MNRATEPPFAQNVAELLPVNVRRAFAKAQLVYDQARVARAVDRVAVHMTVELQDRNPLLLAMLPDALVFTGMLLRRLAFPLQLAYVNCDAKDEVAPLDDLRTSFTDRTVVLVDALDGLGRTRRARALVVAAGAAELRTAVLLGASNSAGEAHYAALPGTAGTPVGVGLGYHGYGVNLPAIHAIELQANEGPS